MPRNVKSNDAHDSLASIRWYWRDWRASTARATLSPLGRLVYLELLFAQYGEPGCSLPNDDASLAGLAGVTREEWASVKAAVLVHFPAWRLGRVANRRVRLEWTKARKFRAEQRRKGEIRAQGASRDPATSRYMAGAASQPSGSPPLPLLPLTAGEKNSPPKPSPPSTTSGGEALSAPPQGSGSPDRRTQTVRGILRNCEPNTKHQPAREDGRTRTLLAGSVYLQRLEEHDPGAAALVKPKDPLPGQLLEIACPARFGALVGRVRSSCEGGIPKAAYCRSALADEMESWLAEVADRPKEVECEPRSGEVSFGASPPRTERQTSRPPRLGVAWKDPT